MQNWKIKRMSTKKLSKLLKAIGSLLYYYQKGEAYPSDCPLCIAIVYCNQCPWRTIEGNHCTDFSLEEFGLDICCVIDKEDWHKIRIPMLRRWKKILKAEMARRVK